MKYVLLIFLILKEVKLREVNYLATVDELRALFINIYSMYVLITLLEKGLKLFYKSEFKTVR